MFKLLLITIFLIPGVHAFSPKHGEKIPVYDSGQKLYMCTVLKVPDDFPNEVPEYRYYRAVCPDYGDFGDEEVHLQPNEIAVYKKRYDSKKVITADQAFKATAKRVYQQRVQALKDIKQFVKDAE